jgi:hypothetical protein
VTDGFGPELPMTSADLWSLEDAIAAAGDPAAAIWPDAASEAETSAPDGGGDAGPADGPPVPAG